MCGPQEEFQLNGKKALSSHSTRAKDRSLSAVATGRFLFCNMVIWVSWDQSLVN